jgi:F-type H+-transporting ATPase subunit delta
MSLFASRYARAFADVVLAQKLDTTAIDTQINDYLAAWTESRELREVFENPSIAAEQKVAVLDKINTRLGLSVELRNLLAVLINHNRIAEVEEVMAEYRKAINARLGIEDVRITTARVLDESDRAGLTAGVAKITGAKVEASFEEDPKILGGVVVRIGSTVYDGSVRGRLDRLRQSLEQ